MGDIILKYTLRQYKDPDPYLKVNQISNAQNQGKIEDDGILDDMEVALKFAVKNVKLMNQSILSFFKVSEDKNWENSGKLKKIILNL